MTFFSNAFSLSNCRTIIVNGVRLKSTFRNPIGKKDRISLREYHWGRWYIQPALGHPAAPLQQFGLTQGLQRQPKASKWIAELQAKPVIYSLYFSIQWQVNKCRPTYPYEEHLWKTVMLKWEQKASRMISRQCSWERFPKRESSRRKRPCWPSGVW